MSLNSRELKLLRMALCRNFSDTSSLKIIVEDSELQASRIALSGSIEVQWHNVLRHATSQGTPALSRLLDTAIKSAPVLKEDADLLGVFVRYGLVTPKASAPAQSPERSYDSLGESPTQVADLLDRIKTLLPSQFEELLFRTNVPTSILPGSHAPQTTRTIALLNWTKAGPPSRMQSLLNALIKMKIP